MATTTGNKAVSVPAILLALSILASLLIVHAAAAAGNYRRALLLPRDPADHVDGIYGGGGQQVLPTTAEEAALGLGGETHQQLADEEVQETAARRAGLLQTQDYPGSGPNGRHDPRNPH